MRHQVFAAIVLFLNATVPIPAAAQAPDAKSDLGANAALKYLQAFALLPTLTKDEEAILNRKVVVFDEAMRKLLDKTRESRVYLRRGANITRCDWSLDYEDGLRLRQPFLPQAVALARLTILQARYEFEHGNAREGWDDVLALLKLANHIEMESILMNQMVGITIEEMTIKAVAPYLPDLKAILPVGASDQLQKLPVGPRLSEVILKEKEMGVEWMIRELKKAELRRPGGWQEFWKEWFAIEGIPDRKFWESVKTYEQAVKVLEDILPWDDRFAQLATRPWKDFDDEYPEFLKKAKADNAVAGESLFYMEGTIVELRRVETRRAQFHAAIAVVQNGPDRLKNFPDPYGGEPFEYRALDRGFELRSAALNKHRPFVLTVGQRKKE